MVTSDSTRNAHAGQGGEPADLAATLNVINAAPLLFRLRLYRLTGRPGYPARPLWRAYVASFVLNLPHTNALIRRLEADPELRRICGFGDVLPHRTTFNRFIQRLSHHTDLVETALAGLTDRLKEILPDLGETVAIDSTTVRSHSNPNRRRISDPEASWTAKNSAHAKKDGKEWHWGYKLHMVADAKYGVSLGQTVTTASRNDSPELPRLMDHAKNVLHWLQPRVAIADRGYDAASNHEYLHQRGTVPIIHIRRTSNQKLRRGIYTTQGVPTCLGGVPMELRQKRPQPWLAVPLPDWRLPSGRIVHRRGAALPGLGLGGPH